jgi:hypothetical protein
MYRLRRKGKWVRLIIIALIMYWLYSTFLTEQTGAE